MKLKKFLIKRKCLILQILDIIQIINVFLSVKILAALIIIIRKVTSKVFEESDETK